jgi:hypothetical protein
MFPCRLTGLGTRTTLPVMEYWPQVAQATWAAVVARRTWFVGPFTGLIPPCSGLARRLHGKGPTWSRHHYYRVSCHFLASWSQRTLIPWSGSHQEHHEKHGLHAPCFLLAHRFVVALPSSSARNQFSSGPLPSWSPSTLGILCSLITKAPSNQGTNSSARARHPRSIDANTKMTS